MDRPFVDAEPWMGVFEDTISVPEILTFYGIKGSNPESAENGPADQEGTLPRPFVYSNTVMSLDGVIAREGMTPSDVALGQSVPEARAADFRLLNAGWATADAILLTRRNLDDEGKTTFFPQHDDLQDYRRQHVATYFPLQVMVTSSGEIPFRHRVFDPDVYPSGDDPITFVVYTTLDGKKKIQAAMQTLPFKRVNHGYEGGRLTIRIKTTASTSTGVDLPELVDDLGKFENVRTVEVMAGGITIQALLKAQLVDEIRLTVAGHLLFPKVTDALMFPVGGEADAGVLKTPNVEYVGIRTFGRRIFFLRGRVTYE